ncbi:MAG: hypothetical protein VX519_10625 [Myxococcota bacterium]|nr:hypothetical protein [Myxococcota bacterium]
MSERTHTPSSLTWAQTAVIFVGGGLFISLGDRAHIGFGVLIQNNTSFIGQAWWVVPMFGAVSLTLIYCYRALRVWFDEPEARRDPKRAALNAALFLIAYCSTGPLAGLGVWLALLLVGIWVLRVVLHRENRATLVLSFLIAVLGPIGEAIVSALGLFHYTNPDIGPVHSWLPAVYLHGGLVVPTVAAFFSPVTHAEMSGIKPPGS